VIVIFTVLLGMYGGGDDQYTCGPGGKSPVSIVLGIASGLIPGYFCSDCFKNLTGGPLNGPWWSWGRPSVLTWLEDACESWVPVASLLGVMAIGFVILEKAEAIAHIISQKLKKLWVFAELLLFVLVGSQVNVHVGMGGGSCGLRGNFLQGFFSGVSGPTSLFSARPWTGVKKSSAWWPISPRPRFRRPSAPFPWQRGWHRDRLSWRWRSFPSC